MPFKEVNSEDKGVLGVVRDVLMRIRYWSEKLDFTIIQLDDYEVGLGQDLLIGEIGVSLPQFKRLFILSGADPVIIPIVRVI